MPYRHTRGLRASGDSDGEIEWPHLRDVDEGGNRAARHGPLENVSSAGDIHSSVLASSSPRRRAAAREQPARTPPREPRRTLGLSCGSVDFATANDTAYAQEAWDAVDDMHGSSSSASSWTTPSDRSTSQRRSTSSSSRSSSSAGEEPGGSVPADTNEQRWSRGTQALPLTSAEQLFAFLILRGQATVTQAAYRIVQRFYNSRVATLLGVMRRSSWMPSLEMMRLTIAPRVRRAWALRIRHVKLQSSGDAETATVGVIFPSDHVRRDFSYRATYDLFFLAGSRGEDERKWHPEFCDSPMHKHRADVLRSGGALQAFVVQGLALRKGDIVSVFLDDGTVLERVTVGPGSFAGEEAGVRDDNSVHAGDFTFSCSRNDEQIGILNARHWLPSKHGRTTWHPVGQAVHEVSSIQMVQSASRPTPDNSRTGTRPGEAYAGPDGILTYELGLAFFMDDFVCRLGRSASAGGVYMLYLSWLFRHRASRHAVRPISLVPAGVDSDLVLKEVMDDLVEGATVGWMVRCPDGREMRVLADAALFIGDYKQVSKTSHMMGHTANAPCPLCSFTKAEGEGARYAGPSSSRDVALVRTTTRTLAVVAAVKAVLSGKRQGSDGGPAACAENELVDASPGVESSSGSD